jgi:hypothetical protein
MASRLVMLDEGKIITGDDLKTILLDMGFDVPDVVPAMRYVSPPRVTLIFSDPEYKAACDERARLMAEAYAIYMADLNRWSQDIKNVAMFLDGLFEMATEVIVGYNPNWTKKREWQIITPSKYSFEQAAQKLTGATKPLNEIDFICYNKF